MKDFDLYREVNRRRPVVEVPLSEEVMKGPTHRLAIEEWALQAVEMRDKEDARRYVKSKGLPIDIGFEKFFSNLQATLDGTSPRAVAIRYSQLTPEQRSAVGLRGFAELFGVKKDSVRGWISPTGILHPGSEELHRKLTELLPFNADEYINISTPPLISLEPGGGSPTRGEEVSGAAAEFAGQGVESKTPVVPEQGLTESPAVKGPPSAIDISWIRGDLTPSDQSILAVSDLFTIPAQDNAGVVESADKGEESTVKPTLGSRKRATERNYELAKEFISIPKEQRPTLKDFVNAKGVARSNLSRLISAAGEWKKGPYAKTAASRASETVSASQSTPATNAPEPGVGNIDAQLAQPPREAKKQRLVGKEGRYNWGPFANLYKEYVKNDRSPTLNFAGFKAYLASKNIQLSADINSLNSLPFRMSLDDREPEVAMRWIALTSNETMAQFAAREGIDYNALTRLVTNDKKVKANSLKMAIYQETQQPSIVQDQAALTREHSAQHSSAVSSDSPTLVLRQGRNMETEAELRDDVLQPAQRPGDASQIGRTDSEERGSRLLGDEPLEEGN